MSPPTHRLPRALYRAEQVRQLDHIAIERCGIPAFTLMQRAAQAALEALLEAWPQVRRVVVFAGSGNNGADGYVLAGLARQQGLQAEVLQVGRHQGLRGDAARARQFALDRPVHIQPFDDQARARLGRASARETVIVDGLLGTGLDRPVEGDYAAAIALINDLGLPVLSIDVPSGTNSDTGQALGCTVEATVTVTFIGLKQGLLTGQGLDAAGRLLYHDLEVPETVFEGPGSPQPAAHRIDMMQVASLLCRRRPSTHKGDCGHTVIVGGDHGYGGAVMMAAEAALRAGSGLVSVITRSLHRSALLARRPEIMVLGTEDPIDLEPRAEELLDRATVVVAGPGLGRCEWSRQWLERVLALGAARTTPLVLDADGLNLLATMARVPGGRKRSKWVLTPHPGEAGRLLGCDTDQVQADRFAAVARLRSRFGGACLLKGGGSLLCFEHGGRQVTELCSEGNPGMASAGMGDVLSGLIGGLMAQGHEPGQALRIAVCVHGESADLAAAEAGQRGLAATDLLPHVRRLVNSPATI